MSEYRFLNATIATWDPEAPVNMVKLSSGMLLAARLIGDLKPGMFEVEDPVVLAIKNGNAFILGKRAS